MVGDERFASASGLSSRTHPPSGSNPVATGGERSASRRTGSSVRRLERGRARAAGQPADLSLLGQMRVRRFFCTTPPVSAAPLPNVCPVCSRPTRGAPADWRQHQARWPWLPALRRVPGCCHDWRWRRAPTRSLRLVRALPLPAAPTPAAPWGWTTGPFQRGNPYGTPPGGSEHPTRGGPVARPPRRHAGRLAASAPSPDQGGRA